MRTRLLGKDLTRALPGNVDSGDHHRGPRSEVQDMPDDRFESGAPQSPAGFGPVKPHLSAGGGDHEQGWQEAFKTKGGGKVPSLDSERVVPRVSLAEQFRARMADGPKRGKRGR